MVSYPIPRGGVAGAVEWAWALLVNRPRGLLGAHSSVWALDAEMK